MHPVSASPLPSLPPLAEEAYVCTDCDLAYGELAVPDAVEEVRGIPGAARAAVDAVPEGARRLRPSAHVWSVAEYVCHLRDVYVGFTVRLRRARTEDEPAIDPMFGDLRAVRFRYADADVDAVLDELRRAVAGFCDEIADTHPNEWTRTVRRLPGEVRTAVWLVRQATHEGRHHVRDIARVGREVGEPPAVLDLTPAITRARHPAQRWLRAVTEPMVSFGVASTTAATRSASASSAARCPAVSGPKGSTVSCTVRPERRWCQTPPATVPSTRSTGRVPAWPRVRARLGGGSREERRTGMASDDVRVEVGEQANARHVVVGQVGVVVRQEARDAVDVHRHQLLGHRVQDAAHRRRRHPEPLRDLGGRWPARTCRGSAARARTGRSPSRELCEPADPAAGMRVRRAAPPVGAVAEDASIGGEADCLPPAGPPPVEAGHDELGRPGAGARGDLRIELLYGAISRSERRVDGGDDEVELPIRQAHPRRPAGARPWCGSERRAP